MEISYFLIPDTWHNTLYFQNNKLLLQQALRTILMKKNPVFLMICLLLSLPFKATEMSRMLSSKSSISKTAYLPPFDA